MLTKDQIRSAASKRKTQVIDVPEWSGEVTIQELSAGDRDYFEQLWSKAEVTANIRGLVVARSLVDADTGTRLYSDAEASELSEYGGAGVQRVFEAVVALNAMGGKRVESVDNAAKN